MRLETDKQSSSTKNKNSTDHLVGAGVIWSFWEGPPPDLVLRCFESIRVQNPSRIFIVLSKDTLPKYLDKVDDYPMFHGRRGTVADFSKIQYLADWVRLTLLEKYGGIWLDASVICTSAVDNWMVTKKYSDKDHEATEEVDRDIINMFPMHANPNIHGNWAMAALAPGNPVIKAWRREMNDIFNEAGPDQIPTEYINRNMNENPTIRNRWNHPTAPPLPYLWVYLALQVILDRQPTLHSHICLHSCTDGPMYRRFQYNIVQGIQDDRKVSQKTADHLALEPFNLDGPDRWFIKLVGTDRQPVQEHLDKKTFKENSGIATLSQLRARTVVYGTNMRTLANLDRVRAAVHLIVATRAFEEKLHKDKVASPEAATNLRRPSRRESVIINFEIEDTSITNGYMDEEKEQDNYQKRYLSKRDSILVDFDIVDDDEPLNGPKMKRENICFDFCTSHSLLEDNNDASSTESPLRSESIYSDFDGESPNLITIL